MPLGLYSIRAHVQCIDTHPSAEHPMLCSPPRPLQAREVMIKHFQEATDEGRAKLAHSEEVPGLLGKLLTAVDEEGNR